MQQTPLTPAAARILDAAGELFYERGIHQVGVDLVAAEAGTTKKTLYDRFGSKEGLVVAYLEARRQRWQAFAEDHLATQQSEAGVERVLAVLDALRLWMGGNPRGCGFINAHAELSGTGHSGNELVRAEKVWVRELYVRLVDEAGVPEPERVGEWLALLHEGAIVELTAGGSASAIDHARDAAHRLLTA